MSPDIAQIIEKIGLRPIITGLTLLLYFILIPFGATILMLIRRTFFLIFVIGSLTLLPDMVNFFIDIFNDVNVDHYFREYIVPYKGTDWFDGFLWGIALCIYIYVVLHIWEKEKKVDKKKEKSVKVEVGNI
jgi:hypothetical protein